MQVVLHLLLLLTVPGQAFVPGRLSAVHVSKAARRSARVDDPPSSFPSLPTTPWPGIGEPLPGLFDGPPGVDAEADASQPPLIYLDYCATTPVFPEVSPH